MKWIGQQIYDQIVRFRNEVYFENDTVTFTSANADDPAVIIENTAVDAQAARLQFKKHRGVDAVDGDNIGEILRNLLKNTFLHKHRQDFKQHRLRLSYIAECRNKFYVRGVNAVFLI